MKLKLNDLKISSFVTTLEKQSKDTVKGGWGVGDNSVDTLHQNCSFESKYRECDNPDSIIYCNYSDCCTAEGQLSCTGGTLNSSVC